MSHLIMFPLLNNMCKCGLLSYPVQAVGCSDIALRPVALFSLGNGEELGTV